MAGMWFRAVTCFNLTEFPNVTSDALAEMLDEQKFVPCGELDREMHGFGPAFGQDSLVRKVKDVFWIQVFSEVKPVPGALVKRRLAERITKIEEEEVRTVGRKEKKELKEMVIDELLAKAEAVQSSLTIMVDPTAKLLVVGTTSKKKTETALTLLLRCVDKFSFARMEFSKTIAGQMSELLLDEATSEFVTDSSLVLKGPGTPAASVRFTQHSLAGPEVLTHLNAGLRPVALELSWRERLSFVLSDEFDIKKLSFLELVTSDFDSAKPEDPDELIDAMLMIQTGELREMVFALTDWLGGAPEKAMNSESALKEAA